ncbi:efflux transporter outer membrane subunit [Roseateles sp. DAIF2]|uniref:efflux transporter outer membrane subunit n=1 Tax=Roseateles sp. DAIF2 TaxID=2714952 RepID=UPI0018A25438|nr:efflux transporter outer membrane subunit [Roseateles sp. DAIF2]QPF72809.1 efflux transporter outer membrane subunit [Roseateles sp. DAIF2]
MRLAFRPFAILPLASLLLAGCVNLAPAYQRPPPAVPTEGQAAAQDAAELPWRGFYIEARLRQVIELALHNNRDLRVAALSVERARAAYQVQQAAELPGLNLSADANRSKDNGNRFSANLGLAAFELDFFGRVKNLNEAALQGFLKSEAARRSAQISLVAETANAWLTLAADLERQRLAQRTLESRQRSLELTQTRYRLGAVGGLPLAQAQSALDSARTELAGQAAQTAQDRHALELLAGAALPEALLPRPDEGLGREIALLPALPAGVPSSVLQRRPDVLAAEHALQGANADIGAARAARFPRISLSGTLGSASSELGRLFERGSWSFGPSLTLPIFDGGAGRANVRASELDRDIALAQYDKAVQSAFREVADALAVSASLTERLAAQQALYASAERQLRLAEAAYRAGGSSQLELLDAQRSLYAAESALIALRQTAQGNRITLYKVLGGGWNDA